MFVVQLLESCYTSWYLTRHFHLAFRWPKSYVVRAAFVPILMKAKLKFALPENGCKFNIPIIDLYLVT